MDIKIENRDICISPSGMPVTVDGLDLAEQQVNLALKIPKNSFVYNRKAGAFCGDFDYESENIEKRTESMINECLLHTGVYAGVEYISKSGDNVFIGIVLDNGFKNKAIEVTVSG